MYAACLAAMVFPVVPRHLLGTVIGHWSRMGARWLCRFILHVPVHVPLRKGSRFACTDASARCLTRCVAVCVRVCVCTCCCASACNHYQAEAGFDVFTCVVALGFLMVSLVLVEKEHHAVPMPHDLTTVNKYSQWGRKGKKKEPCPPIPPQLRGPLPNADAAKSKPLSDVGAAGTASPGSGGGAGAGAGGAGAGAGAGTASERKHAADDALVEDASATVHDNSDVGDKFRLGLLISWFVVGLVLKATLALAYLGGSDLRSGAILQAAFVESIFNSGSGLVSLFTFGLSRPLLVEYAKTFTSLRRWYRTKAFGAQDVGFLASGAEAQSSPELLALIRDACSDNQLIKKRRYAARTGGGTAVWVGRCGDVQLTVSECGV